VICPEHTSDLREAVVHGALHLVGYDHETDDGEMLRVQDDILATLGLSFSADSRQRPPT
jgi:probable rRNA maturation factor